MTLPRAGQWMIIWMLMCLPVCLVIALIVHHFWKRRERRRVHDQVEKAKADILADGKVEGPKGPYVPHKPYAPTTGKGTPRETAPPGQKAYRGMEWQ